MKLKYGDLPSRDVCAKLSMISFSSPKKNLDVYRLVTAVKPLQNFFANEHDKILKRYGTNHGNGKFSFEDDEHFRSYEHAMKSLLDLEIKDDIPLIDFSFDDFDPDKCAYPTEKHFWMNASDINSILTFIQKMEC